jgi:hypothetical protein
MVCSELSIIHGIQSSEVIELFFFIAKLNSYVQIKYVDCLPFFASLVITKLRNTTDRLLGLSGNRQRVHNEPSLLRNSKHQGKRVESKPIRIL